ncbi:MAG: RNA polymerase-binding protein DksA [Burkholderiaceae bacterium]|nr:MAG: RNA polymerase-binding protein DksA [Burkholderiaceae bacterium]
MATAKPSTKTSKSSAVGKAVSKKPAGKVTAKAAPKKAVKATASMVKSKVSAKPGAKTSKPTGKTNAKSAAKPATKTAGKTMSKAPAKAPGKATKTAVKPATKTVAKPVTKPAVNSTNATKTTPASPKGSSSKSVSKPSVKESSPVKNQVVATPSKSSYKPSTTILAAGLISEAQLLKMGDKDYMNEAQTAFFLYRLQQMEAELRQNAGETTEHLRETAIVPDPADRATIEEEHALELRTRDRERKLLKKVQQAIARIEAGEYGYCEETGEPIGIPRLLARPTATLSLEAQQRRELKQKMYGD